MFTQFNLCNLCILRGLKMWNYSGVQNPHTVWWSSEDVVCFPLQGLVVAGLADMTRPAEKLSTSQSGVLTATGKIQLVPDSDIINLEVWLQILLPHLTTRGRVGALVFLETRLKHYINSLTQNPLLPSVTQVICKVWRVSWCDRTGDAGVLFLLQSFSQVLFLTCPKCFCSSVQGTSRGEWQCLPVRICLWQTGGYFLFSSQIRKEEVKENLINCYLLKC